MAKAKIGVCAYCGTTSNVTREHVVPRSLFLDPLPPSMVTVGACHPCNNGKSRDDSYLRDFLLSDISTGRNLVVQSLRGSKLMRSVKKNRSEIARTVVKQARRKPIYSPGGIYLGSPYAAPVETKRLESSFEKMVRGLYYNVYKSLLPRDAEFLISRIENFHIQQAWDEMIESKAAMNGIHSQVFACQYVADSASPCFSRWLLLFYNTILIEVLTLPTKEIENLFTEEEVNHYADLIAPDSNPEPTDDEV